jgi:NADH-quinone oxidoreductase subunit A
VSSEDSLLFVVGLLAGPIAFLALMLGVNSLLSPKRPNALKNSAYECGIPQAASPWRSVNVRYSTAALLLVIFDAEMALLLAVASGVRGSLVAGIEVAARVLFLAFGLLYAWKKGALRWPA